MTPTRILDQQLLDHVSAAAQESPRRRRNFNLHLSEADASHRLLNGIEPDSYIPPHRHLSADKDETIIALRGRLGVVFFDEAGNVADAAIIEPDGHAVGVNIPHGVFHSLVALEAGSVFFEAKAGPYQALLPQEKASFAPAEGAPDAANYLAELKKLFQAAD